MHPMTYRASLLFLAPFLLSLPEISLAKSAPNNAVTTVLVTGASSGIGRSIALEFAKSSKYRVWAAMRSPASWTHPPADNIVTAAMDVTSELSVESTVSEMIKREGKIDIVVNNAGYGLLGALEAVKIEAAKVCHDNLNN